MKKYETIQVRVEPQAKDYFYEACKKRGEKPSEVIRRMMEEYTQNGGNI